MKIYTFQKVAAELRIMRTENKIDDLTTGIHTFPQYCDGYISTLLDY